MKVSIIAGNYYNSDDGIGRYTKNLVKGLKKSDSVKEVIIAGYNTSTVNVFNQKPVQIPKIVKNILNKIVVEIQYFLRFYRNVFELYKELNITNEIQVYHAVSPSEAISALRLKRRPLVTTFHDVIPLLFENRYMLERMYFILYSKMAKKSDCIIADSYNTKADLVKIVKIPECKIKVIYPGIDTSKFYPLLKKRTNANNVLYVGGMTKRKGIYELLYAFEKLVKKNDKANLFMIGSGEELMNIKAEAIRMKIDKNVSILGFVNDEQLLEWFSYADLFVYPSKYEGFGYTPLEAMACGVPVLTSNNSSIPEVVGDAAITVDPNNINEIFLKMDAILSDSGLRDILIKRGFEQVKKFSWENCTRNTLDLYMSLF